MNRKNLWMSGLDITESNIVQAKNLFAEYSIPISNHPLEMNDHDLVKIIQNDVKRLFPKEKYFTDEIKYRIEQILTIYCRVINLEYKQGWHDLVGFIMYAINANTNNDTYIAFLIFFKLNSLCKYWYYDSIQGNHSLEFNYNPKRLDMHQNEMRIQFECRFAVDHILQKSDRRMWEKIKEIGLEPHVFGLRWLRTLFLHEFPLEQSCILWDHLIYNLANIDKNYFLWLPKFVFVAIIQHLREEILLGDISSGMSVLMRPHLTDVNPILDQAKDIQNEFMKTSKEYLASLDSQQNLQEPLMNFETMQNLKISLSTIERECRFDKPIVIKELKKIYELLNIPSKLALCSEDSNDLTGTKNTLKEIEKELENGDLILKKIVSSPNKYQGLLYAKPKS
eukprot:NODE_932_length_3021_cov_0.390828.p1 type:complete len:394 gc:universal NODE_932_length_3021_cov_0.390828:1096-2277(+)